jgi:hypothetical protein
VKRILAAVVLGLVALAACACNVTPKTAHEKPTLLVFGDSLTVQSEDAANFLYGSQYRIVFRAVGGSGACDWSSEAVVDRAAYRPSAVVVAFSGNTSNCSVADWNRAKCTGVIGNYRANLAVFRDAFRGLPVKVVGSPAMHDNIGWFPCNGNLALNAMYRSFAAESGWTYTNSADDALTPGHLFTYTRPAFPGNGPTVIVRAPDGVHLTPAGAAYYGAVIGTVNGATQ